MNKERLEIIATWLEAGAPHKHGVDGFSMREYRRSDGCDTVCCIAGAAQQFFAPEAVGLPESIHAAAQLLLDLHDTHADRLFMPLNDFADFSAGPNKPGYVTPMRAAKVIRHLMATGEVDWSVA